MPSTVTSICSTVKNWKKILILYFANCCKTWGEFCIYLVQRNIADLVIAKSFSQLAHRFLVVAKSVKVMTLRKAHFLLQELMYLHFETLYYACSSMLYLKIDLTRLCASLSQGFTLISLLCFDIKLMSSLRSKIRFGAWFCNLP